MVKSPRVHKERDTAVIPVRVSLELAASIRQKAASSGVSVNSIVVPALSSVVHPVANHADTLPLLPAELDAALHKRSEATGVAVPQLLEKAVRELLRPHKGKKKTA